MGISVLSLPLLMLRRNNSAAYEQWKVEYMQHDGTFIRELVDNHPSHRCWTKEHISKHPGTGEAEFALNHL